MSNPPHFSDFQIGYVRKTLSELKATAFNSEEWPNLLFALGRILFTYDLAEPIRALCTRPLADGWYKHRFTWQIARHILAVAVNKAESDALWQKIHQQDQIGKGANEEEMHRAATLSLSEAEMRDFWPNLRLIDKEAGQRFLTELEQTVEGLLKGDLTGIPGSGIEDGGPGTQNDIGFRLPSEGDLNSPKLIRDFCADLRRQLGEFPRAETLAAADRIVDTLWIAIGLLGGKLPERPNFETVGTSTKAFVDLITGREHFSRFLQAVNQADDAAKQLAAEVHELAPKESLGVLIGRLEFKERVFTESSQTPEKRVGRMAMDGLRQKEINAMPDVGRITLLCDELDGEPGLTANNVRRLRATICRLAECSIENADNLSLEDGAAILERRAAHLRREAGEQRGCLSETHSLTVGELFNALRSSEEVFAANSKTADGSAAEEGSIAAARRYVQAAALRFQPDQAQMPGIDRIQLLCDELDNGDGLIAANVAKLRAKVCRAKPCSLDEANALSLEQLADVLEGKVFVAGIGNQGIQQARTPSAASGGALLASQSECELAVTHSKPITKRSTERGEARAKLIAAFTKHHQYADGGCLNQEPIGNNELAKAADVSPSSASAFFNDKFDGHTKYKALCRDTGKLVVALKLLNGEFAPFQLLGDKSSDRAASQQIDTEQKQ
jgi:hypothetical protein